MPANTRPALTTILGRLLIVATLGIVGLDSVAMAAPDAQPAAEQNASDGAPASAPAGKSRKHRQKRAATASPVSSEARHEVCLAFLRRHGYTCDTWVEPTCGADSGYYRPAECVPPHVQ
jgi:hypothetical protein